MGLLLMYLNKYISIFILLAMLYSLPSLLVAKEHKKFYANETMYRSAALIIKSAKTQLNEAEITKYQIGTFPIFVDLGKKYFAGFRGSNGIPKKSCTNTSFALSSIQLSTYLKKNQIALKEWKQAYPDDNSINRLVTLVKTNCKIPFFREFIFDSNKESIESGGEYGAILINQSNVFFMAYKHIDIILPK